MVRVVLWTKQAETDESNSTYTWCGRCVVTTRLVNVHRETAFGSYGRYETEEDG